ncbi:prostaglandin E synthase 2 [Culicoides brevitarsis]|uniref:prostaglandin E synthase 2 n=1 Tax=Culicoides brevitarsis TaxID=469753 RepID=UPI00307BCB3B
MMTTFRAGLAVRPIRNLFRQDVPTIRGAIIHRSYATKSRGFVSSTIKPIVLGVTLGAGIGVAYTYYSKQQKGIPGFVIEQNDKPFIIDKFPENIKITREIKNPQDSTGLELVLFQFQTCPFCCKVRSYLDYKGLSYSVVEVDAVLRQSIKWSPYKKVPLLLAKTKDGRYVQLTDSSMIVSALETYLKNPEKDIAEIAALYPNVAFYDEQGNKKTDVFNKYFLMFREGKKALQDKEAIKSENEWRAWADDHLVHLISPNVYRSKAEALETFEWFSDTGEWDVHFPSWERNLMVYTGAAAMYLISKRLKKRHKLTDDVRSHMYDACNKWTNELKARKSTFMGGKTPNLADLAVFGVLSSMEGCAAFKDCLDNTKIGEWFYEMKVLVQQNRGNVVPA